VGLLVEPLTGLLLGLEATLPSGFALALFVPSETLARPPA
jgi:hypothetical protein